MERRLSAILAADVVGYSRLVERDETGTLAALRAHRKELLEPKVAEHKGRIVKLMGDGALVEFSSVVEAVQCAVEVQKELSARNANVPKDKRIEFRIGVNLGDVVVEDDDIYGDGVNVAARLEGLAEPGGICLSSDAYRQVRGKIEVDFEDLGERRAKNLAEPLRVYRVAIAGPLSGASSLETTRSALTNKPSIAVLPFANMSGDPEQEYFSDGLTEDLITALAHWRSFPVIARNSTFTYKDKATSITQAARELSASYVLRGSVRKAGRRVRVTAQLSDGATGHHVWAERYDRDLQDIFALQDELTHRITAVLAPEVSRAELKRSASKRPSDLDAWDHYLRGEAALAQFSVDGTREARDHFERAIAVDPEYSDAFTGLAQSYNRELLLHAADDRDAAMDRAIVAARRAIELDPASSRAHFALSTAYIWRDEHDLALAEAHLAVELNPNDPVVLHALGNKSDLAGDPEGIARMKLAQQFNPRDPEMHVHLTFLARACVNAHDYEAAITSAQAAINRHPEYPHAHFILAIALAHAGRSEDAGMALQRCDRLSPGFVASRAGWHPYTNEASNRHVHDGLSQAKAAAANPE